MLLPSWHRGEQPGLTSSEISAPSILGTGATSQGDYGGNHWLQSKICSLVLGSSISLFALKSFCDRFVTPPNPRCLFPLSQKNNNSHVDSWSPPCWLNIPRSQVKNLPIQAGKLGNPGTRWGLMRVDDYFFLPVGSFKVSGSEGEMKEAWNLGACPPGSSTEGTPVCHLK